MTCGVCTGSKSVTIRTTQPPTTRKPLPKRTKCTRDEIGRLGCDQECLIVDEKPQVGFRALDCLSGKMMALSSQHQFENSLSAFAGMVMNAKTTNVSSWICAQQ